MARTLRIELPSACRLDALIDGIPEAYSYAPASNRLTAIATPTASRVLSLDAAGNLTDNGAGQTFTYNQAGRLASAETTADITTYRYNALGLRTHKEGMTNVVFHYDAGGRLLAETTPGGTLIRSYVWFGDEPLAQLDGALDAETPTYLHTDHLATPRLGTDQAGIPVWRWESPAFGDAPPSLQLRTVNLRFPGQYFDAETGLHQNWHRDYDPQTGRYLQSDPIGLAGLLNTYAYVFNNPLRWIDPLGLFCTFDFAKHYYSGGGSTIDLGGVGLLGAFRRSASVQGSVDSFKQKVASTAKAKASSLCKNCDKGTKSTSFNLNDTAETNVTGEPCLFAVGGSTFFRKAGCGVTANCDNRTFSFGCSLGFSIRDWFRDPTDLGFELPGGTPYRINADWSDSLSGSGNF